MFYIHFILLLTTQVLILSCASVDESLLSDEREQVDKSGGETQQLLETLLRKTLAGESSKDSNGDDKDVLEVHVPINLLFVGSTQPNDASSLRHQTLMQTLEPWFKQVAHNLRHLVAPVGIEQTRTEYQETRESYIEYNVSLSIIELSNQVATVIEEILKTEIREEKSSCDSESADSCNIDLNVFGDQDLNLELYYMDAHRMSRVLADLLVSLRLAPNSYSFFILNPTSPVDTNTSAYGYRAGFSQSELNAIWRDRLQLPSVHVEHVPLGKAKSTEFASVQSSPTPPPASAHDDNSNNNDDRARHIDRRAESQHWANTFLKQLQQYRVADTSAESGELPLYTPAQRHACMAGDADDLACLFRIAPPSSSGALALAQEVAEFGSVVERRYLSTILSRENQGWQNGEVGGDNDDSIVRADPLVDAWVTSHRFAFLDLSAGPFEFGPTIAATGVKRYDTIPRFPTVADQQASTVRRQSSPLPSVEYWQTSTGNFKNAKSADNERHLFQTLHQIHCNDAVQDKQTIENCDKLTGHIDALIDKPLQQRAAFSSLAAASRAAEDDVNAHIIHDRSTALFLYGSKLAAEVLGAGVRQLFLPPSSLMLPPIDTQISMHLFLVSDHAIYSPLGEHTFDWKRFRAEIQRLRGDNVEWSFRVTRLSLSDDPVLASSLAVSQRVETLPFLAVDGTFESRVVRYIDSGRLRERLNAEHLDASAHGVGAASASHIQLFLFSLGTDQPVLIDKYYSAKTVANDMIIAVQSNVRSFASRVAANGEILSVDLRNPFRAVLEQSGVLLGGLVPAHIGFDGAQHVAHQNWQWAVGSRPTTPLAHVAHVRYGLLDTDAAQRNALEYALSRSMQVQSDARRRLSALSQSPLWFSWPAMGSLQFTSNDERRRAMLVDLLAHRRVAHEHRRQIVAAMSSLDFPSGFERARRLRAVDSMTDTLVDRIEALHEHMVCSLNDNSRAIGDQFVERHQRTLSWTSIVIAVLLAINFIAVATVLFVLRSTSDSVWFKKHFSSPFNNKLKVN